MLCYCVLPAQYNFLVTLLLKEIMKMKKKLLNILRIVLTALWNANAVAAFITSR